MYQLLAVIAPFVLIYSAVAGRAERSWVSGPIVSRVSLSGRMP